MQIQDRTGPALAQVVGFLNEVHRLTACSGRHHFFAFTSFRIWMSSA